MGTRTAQRDGEWLDLVADLLTQPLTCLPDEKVCRLLVRTFDAPGSVFHFQHGGGPLGGRVWPPEHFAPHIEEQTHWAVHESDARHPLMRYHRLTGLGSCLQVDEVPSGIADRRTVRDWRALGRRWGGVQEQVSIPVRFLPRDRRWFLLGRSDPFTAQEMATLRRLQMLLTGLDHQVGAFARWSGPAGSAGAEAADALRLTPRELAVLGLLARTLTAAAIGRRLGVSERTVQKHLQRIYAKLGVSDRLGAVCRAQTVGLLPVPLVPAAGS
ncbi:regulatory LuxR family protein [Pseudonocardia sediminis]|uniref:Regulatory LuxR family protein n=1 Tax=Pseudonocardia sediminis TaxID=1397368 RepID=A0A4Q7V3X0_PSEST|nr:LuxR C-terminal-related transcriptional regulator [Pseudonocardia sediminis]RZT88161.1 regulatory LuxR family protein [Pseudonocardia sediminis]